MSGGQARSNGQRDTQKRPDEPKKKGRKRPQTLHRRTVY